MTSQAVTLGRNTTSSQVDFDLSLEAPAFKISRKQVCNGVGKVEVHETTSYPKPSAPSCPHSLISNNVPRIPKNILLSIQVIQLN